MDKKQHITKVSTPYWYVTRSTPIRTNISLMTDNTSNDRFSGAIAIVDILGFGNMLRDHSIDYIKNQIINILLQISEGINFFVNRDRYRFNKFANDNTINYSPLEYVLFSDTILLYIKANNDCKINTPEFVISSLCYACSLLLSKGFENNIPLRGALTFGECLIHENPFYFLGKSIYEISSLEKNQDWAGIVLSDNLNSFSFEHTYLTSYVVPFKKNPERRTVINWILHYTIPDFEKCFDSNNPNVIIKKENTIKFYQDMTKNYYRT